MAYSKVVLTETDNKVSKTEKKVQEDNETLSKFDTSYNDKVSNLYSEFDKISTTEDIDTDIETDVVTKKDVVVAKKREKVSFEFATFLTCMAIVIVAFFSLCMINISVINNVSSSIDIVSEEVTQAHSDLTDRQEELNAGKYADDGNNWSAGKVFSKGKKVDNLVDATTETIEDHPSNWFDAVCDFFSNLFGR